MRNYVKLNTNGSWNYIFKFYSTSKYKQKWAIWQIFAKRKNKNSVLNDLNILLVFLAIDKFFNLKFAKLLKLPLVELTLYIFKLIFFFLSLKHSVASKFRFIAVTSYLKQIGLCASLTRYTMPSCSHVDQPVMVFSLSCCWLSHWFLLPLLWCSSHMRLQRFEPHYSDPEPFMTQHTLQSCCNIPYFRCELGGAWCAVCCEFFILLLQGFACLERNKWVEIKCCFWSVPGWRRVHLFTSESPHKKCPLHFSKNTSCIFLF